MAGIDLGTTNSAIGVVERGAPRIIKYKPTEPHLPSVVFIDKRGGIFLGTDARDAMINFDEPEGTGHTSWKKRMGQSDSYDFPAAKKRLTAPELSALIIGELLKAYRREMDQDLLSCVITVPAKFDQSAYMATSKAAELAGLQHHPLLAEPIAAALAYGFTSGDQRANWMVFDLGGGTLDIALMAVREGKLVVLQKGQDGDPVLGGSGFDREILDFVLGPPAGDRDRWQRYQKLQPGYEPLRKQYKLEGFSEETHRTSWNRLLLACELAKIRLSRKTEDVVEVDTTLCVDEAGKGVKVEVPLTRAVYEQLIGPEIDRAMHVCERLLASNRMSGKSIDQLILVGGPTKTPYIQRMLAERLGMDVGAAVDPMTAVASGAALHSETLETPDHVYAATKAATGSVRVELRYERSSKQPVCPVAGIITGDVEDLTSLHVEIVRDDGLWSSAQLPVDETGFFTADLVLVQQEGGRPHQSEFCTRVMDAGGREIASVAEPKVWHPFPTVTSPLANSLSVATVGNEAEVVIAQGEPLPKKRSRPFRTAKLVRKGSADDVLTIPVIQAVTSLLGSEETEHADCHIHMGSLTISATDHRMSRDLPKGSDLDVTFEMSDCQELKVYADIPLLDERFEGTVRTEPYGVSIDELRLRFAAETQRLAQIRDLQKAHAVPEVASALDLIDRLQHVQKIERELARAAEGEKAAQTVALKAVLELAATLNEVWKHQTYYRIRSRLSKMRKAAEGDHLKNLDTLDRAVRAMPPDGNLQELERIESEVEELDVQLRHRPFFVMLMSVMALSGIRVSSHQHQVFNEASDLGNRLIERGAPDTLTTADLQQVEAMNRKIREAYPDLEDRIKEYQRKNPGGQQLVDSFGSTVSKRE